MASRYGVDPDQILSRLRAGRFRVKANLELTAAKRFMEYLESEGALCSIVNANGTVVERSAAVASPTIAPDEPDDFLNLYTPPPAPQPSEDAKNYESGLAAGFGGASDSQELGALSDPSAASSGSLRLSMLDGDGSEASESTAASSVADASDVEAFLPPDALKESILELADDKPEPLPTFETKQVPTPRPEIYEPVVHNEDTDVADRVTSSSILKRALEFFVGTARGRLTMGVFLAFLIGFGLSSTVASGMEDGQYVKEIGELEAAYNAVDSIEGWSRLEEVREATIGSLERRRRNIVVTSVLVWFAVGGVLLFLWLRVINWDRLQESLLER